MAVSPSVQAGARAKEPNFVIDVLELQQQVTLHCTS